MTCGNETGRGERVSFSKRLKQAMDERKISQTELAAHIGKGKSSVSQYLSGKNIPKNDVQQKIAEVLDCTVAYLNSEVPENDNSESGIRNITVAEAAKRLDKSEQFIRVALQRGIVKFGFAVKLSSRYSYHISPKLLNEYIGYNRVTNKMDEELIIKKEQILDLLIEVDDDLVGRYFDDDSDEMLDDKIEVLTALKEGKEIKDIPKYYDILELLPKEGIWD